MGRSEAHGAGLCASPYRVGDLFLGAEPTEPRSDPEMWTCKGELNTNMAHRGGIELCLHSRVWTHMREFESLQVYLRGSALCLYGVPGRRYVGRICGVGVSFD